MQTEEFKNWLIEKNYAQETVENRISNCRKVEKYYEDLDKHFDVDKCQKILNELNYTVEDERENNPPAHPIFINGNIREGSATLKQAVKLYAEFRSF